MTEVVSPLGVFVSCDFGLGLSLGSVQKLGVPTVHLHAPSRESRNEGLAKRLQDQLKTSAITATCMFVGFEGESYDDIPATKKTVGLVPREHRQERTEEFKLISNFAGLLGIGAVGMHLGFIPEEQNSNTYDELVVLVRSLCEFCAKNSQAIHLETGQESVNTLRAFLKDVGSTNLFVNFDPANMILYGVGDPLPALRELAPYVRSVHCKDARWSEKPGETWGKEVPLGQGDVGMPEFIQLLQDIQYEGPLTIEREIPNEPDKQLREIAAGLALLRELSSQVETKPIAST